MAAVHFLFAILTLTSLDLTSTTSTPDLKLTSQNHDPLVTNPDLPPNLSEVTLSDLTSTSDLSLTSSDLTFASSEVTSNSDIPLTSSVLTSTSDLVSEGSDLTLASEVTSNSDLISEDSDLILASSEVTLNSDLTSTPDLVPEASDLYLTPDLTSPDITSHLTSPDLPPAEPNDLASDLTPDLTSDTNTPFLTSNIADLTPTSQNPDITFQTSDLVSQNSDLTSKTTPNADLISKNLDLPDQSREMTSQNDDLVSQSHDLASQNHELTSQSTPNRDLTSLSPSSSMTSENTKIVTSDPTRPRPTRSLDLDVTSYMRFVTPGVSVTSADLILNNELDDKDSETPDHILQGQTSDKISREKDEIRNNDEIRRMDENGDIITDKDVEIGDKVEIADDKAEIKVDEEEIEKIEIPVKNNVKIKAKITGTKDDLKNNDKTETKADTKPKILIDDKINHDNFDIKADNDKLTSTDNTPKPIVDLASEKIDPVSDKVDLASEINDPASDKVDIASEKIDPASDKHDLASEKIDPASDKHDLASEKIDPASEKNDPASDKHDLASETSNMTSESDLVSQSDTTLPSDLSHVTSESSQPRLTSTPEPYRDLSSDPQSDLTSKSTSDPPVTSPDLHSDLASTPDLTSKFSVTSKLTTLKLDPDLPSRLTSDPPVTSSNLHSNLPSTPHLTSNFSVTSKLTSPEPDPNLTSELTPDTSVTSPDPASTPDLTSKFSVTSKLTTPKFDLDLTSESTSDPSVTSSDPHSDLASTPDIPITSRLTSHPRTSKLTSHKTSSFVTHDLTSDRKSLGGDLHDMTSFDDMRSHWPPGMEVLARTLDGESHFMLRDPRYLVIAPRVVVAGGVYRAVINTLPPAPLLMVRLALLHHNVKVAAVEHQCTTDVPQVLELMVPQGSSKGDYRLRLEGNELGSLSGSAFVNETWLQYSPKTTTLLIHTDRPVYKQGDTVRVRVLVLDAGTRITHEPVDIFALNPQGVLVARWMSKQCREGAINVELSLSDDPDYGGWLLRVESAHTFNQHLFTVEHFEHPHYQVEVRVPSFLSSAANYLEGTVVANYSSGAPVTGNVTVRAAVVPIGPKAFPQRTHSYNSIEHPHAMADGGSGVQELSVCFKKGFTFAGIFHFKFPMSDLEELLHMDDGRVGGREVRVWVRVGDVYRDTTHTAHASTRIFNPDLKLAFLGGSPQVLHPPMPFRFYLVASQEDGSLIPNYRLARHRLLVTPEVTLMNGDTRRLLSRTVRKAHAKFPLWQAELDLHVELSKEESSIGIQSVLLRGELRDSEGIRSYASLVAVPHHSPSGRHLHISTSTQNPKVGEYIILHVRSNFYLDNFRYILLSRGCIVEAGQHSMEASLRTFPLPLTSEVAGVSTVLVYSVGREQELVAAALTFPVDALTGKGLHVDLRAGQGGGVVAEVRADPGSTVALSGVDWATYSLQAGNDLTHTKVLHNLWEGITSEQEPFEHRWNNHNGRPSDILLLPRPSPARDPNTTFSYANLLVLTDGDVGVAEGGCASGMGGHCLLPGCFTTLERCDGNFDCPDRIDERGCTERGTEEESLSWYRQRRSSRLSNHYSEPWVWKEVEVGSGGVVTLNLTLPPTSTHLALTAFSLHPLAGLSILEEPIEWKVKQGFWVTVEAPETVGLWEQVGIRVTTSSRYPGDVSASIILPASPYYDFVDIPAFHPREHPSHQKGRRRVDEHRHWVDVKGQSTRTIHLPILPTHPGKVEVVIEVEVEELGIRERKEVLLNVEPPGALQEHHTSLLIDLSNRQYIFTFLDVTTDPTLVPGSAQAHVAVFKNAVGPLMPRQPPTPMSLLNLPMAGCEGATFSLLLAGLQARQEEQVKQESRPLTGVRESINQWGQTQTPGTLWRSVPQDANQWARVQDRTQDTRRRGRMDGWWRDERWRGTGGGEETDFKEHLAHLYQTVLAHQNKDGGFKHFRSSSGSSVWVTSQVVRALNMASLTWPHLVYVDPQVTDKAIKFLLEHQLPNGGWGFGPGGNVGDRKLVPPPASPMFTQHSTQALNLSTSAHTMLTLLALKDLPSPLDEQVTVAVSKCRMWLEENLNIVGNSSRPLEVALVSLALHLSNSPKADIAFHDLTHYARQARKHLYWGEDLVPEPTYRVESQRSHLKPRHPHTHDSGNVAATAYSLILYTRRGEVLTQNIVRWLHSQRAHDGGWGSTQDTLAAWEALLEHSERQFNEWRNPVTLQVSPLHDSTGASTFTLQPSSLPILFTRKLPDVKSVRVQGRGRGLAVLQLTSRYYVTRPDLLPPPATPTFLLTSHASWQGRNGSSIAFKTCVKWLFREAGDASGLAVLEVTVPTGYGASSEVLQNLVMSKKVANLLWAEFKQRKATFFFEKVSAIETCVQFRVERWFPVANLSSVLPVKVYEYYAPEHQQTELLDMSSVTLDICQVCGSYQCPNCPILSYYSSSAPRQSSYVFTWVLIFSLIYLLHIPLPDLCPS